MHEFALLFEGFKTAYGLYVLTGEKKSGNKLVGKASSHKGDVTMEMYSDHLMGVKGLGVIPINEQSMCRFGAIDVDEYPIDLELLNTNVRDAKMPLMVCRTKSGGAHLFLFLREYAEAELVQRKLKEMAARLGYGTSEIFPKQTKVLVERGDAGNWINLPYFDDAGHTTRYGLSELGEGMKIAGFIKRACEIAVEPAKFESMSWAAQKFLPDGPPCLQQLAQSGFPEGTRNKGLFNLGIYAKKAFPDSWQRKLEGYNNSYLKPPLTGPEVLAVIKSLGGKEYTYTCKDQPIQSFCNSAVCRTCKFGVGGADLGMPKLGTLTKLCTIPPLWFLDVETNGGEGRLELTTEELQHPLKFQAKCMMTLNTMPLVLKRENWQSIVMKLLVDVNIIEVPLETTPAGQFMAHLGDFLMGRVQAKMCEEILLGKPWMNNGEIHFRWQDFLHQLKMKKFTAMEENKLVSLTKEIPGFRKQFHNIRGKGVNCIVLKAKYFQAQDQSFTLPPQPEDQL